MFAISAFPPSLTAPTGNSSFTFSGLGLKPAPDSQSKPSDVPLFAEFVDPPEMPEAVKAEALKGTTCYYGFYFPDSVLHAFDNARQIECPPHVNPWAWKWQRKSKILEDAADGLGIELFTHLTMAVPESFELEASTNAKNGDIVHFAYSTRYKYVASLCLPVGKIKELMRALGIEGEPQWILAW